MNGPLTAAPPAAMRERALPLSYRELRAVLNGSKTQIRFPADPQPRLSRSLPSDEGCVFEILDPNYPGIVQHLGRSNFLELCPYGAPGDRLWVQESFLTGYDVEDGVLQDTDENGEALPEKIWYAATDELVWYDTDTDERRDNPPWKSATQMPRAASRILPEIVRRDIQQLSAIALSNEDCFAEGITAYTNGSGEHYMIPDDPSGKSHRTAWCPFSRWWDMKYDKKTQFKWDRDPWVYVLEFRRIET